MKILVIDDDPITVRALQRLLGEWGHEVIWALSGERGLRLMREEHPHAVLLDIMLGPGSISGWDVAREALLDEWIRGIPIVVVSGLAPDEVRRGAEAVSSAMSGARWIFSKPVDPDQLHRVLEHIRRADVLTTAPPPPDFDDDETHSTPPPAHGGGEDG